MSRNISMLGNTMKKSDKNTFLMLSGLSALLSLLPIVLTWGRVTINSREGLMAMFNGRSISVKGYNGEIGILGINLPIWVFCAISFMGIAFITFSMIGVINILSWISLILLGFGLFLSVVAIVLFGSNDGVGIGPFTLIFAIGMFIALYFHYRNKGIA